MSHDELLEAMERDPFLKLCHLIRNGVMCAYDMHERGEKEKGQHRLKGILQELQAMMDFRKCDGHTNQE